MSKLDHIKIGDTDYEVQDSELTTKVSSLETSVTAVQTEVENKQDKLTAGDPITIGDGNYQIQIVDNVISLIELSKYYTITGEAVVLHGYDCYFNLTDLESDNFKILSYTGTLAKASSFTAKMLSSATQEFAFLRGGVLRVSITPTDACSYRDDGMSLTISNLTADIKISADCLCLTGDTLISMSDGTQKRVDCLELGDKILAIDPNTLELVEDEVTYTDSKCNKTHNEYDVWAFEGGYEIKTVHRHRLYNCESEAFVNMDEWAIGEHTRTICGKEIVLISHKHINELVKHYTLFTKKYNNYFANGMLTGNKYSKELTFED